MTDQNRISNFFNGKNSSNNNSQNITTQDIPNKKPRSIIYKKEFEKANNKVRDLFSDVDWGHPEPEDKNSYEYAKYVANLLLRNGVEMDMSPRDKKKIMEYILGDSKKEDINN